METTVKIYKKDAIIIRQLQGYLDLKERTVNQPEFFHEMLSFLFKHQQDFLDEMEQHQKLHEEIFEKWMKVLVQRMKEEEF